MRINKFLFKFKILVLLFSFVFNIFMPTYLECRGRLTSGGQLSHSVISEKANKNIKKKSLLAENIKASINNSANLDANVSNQEPLQGAASVDVVEKNQQDPVKIEAQVLQTEKVTSEEKSEQKQELQPEQGQEKSGIKVDLNKNVAPEAKNLRKVFKFPKSNNIAQKNLLDQAGQQKVVKEKIENDDEETVVFNFEDVDLANVAAYVETIFKVTFITPEAITPVAQNSKALSGNKISFKTQRPLTKKQAWSLFVTFLNMAGFALVPMADPKFHRIELIAEAKKSAIPVYINTDNLPDSGIIRYGYFVKDCPLDTIKTVIESLKGSSSDLLMLNDHNAFIITDDAYNIKILMKIVRELDKVTMPQTMSVLRLYKGEATYAKEIYEKLIAEGENSAVAARLFGPKNPSKTLYFPKKAKVIVDERTNSLILLGTIEAIGTIEDFVRKYIDIDIDTPYSPLYIYDLKYANAQDVANLMTNLVKFGDSGKGGKGALRGGDKYFKNMTFTPETENNRIIIRGDYDDYLKVKDIIDGIDEAPKQVAVEILILSVEVLDEKKLGAQLRNQFKSPNGTPLNFQTSGLNLGGSAKQIVVNQSASTPGSGAFRLLGDLISLVTGGSSAGVTAVTLGSDKYGIWGVFGVLDQITNTQVVANPFLTVTNNTKANVKLGETERIVTQKVVGTTTTDAYSNYDAFIDVTVTPKINSDGMIVTELVVLYDDFIVGTDGTVKSKNSRKIQTTVVLSNNEVLALGGLLKDRTDDTLSQVPILGKIPIIGWLFKNKNKTKKKDDLLILVNTHIVDPDEKIKENTRRHLKEYKDTLDEFEAIKLSKDPVDRSFFKEKPSEYKLDNYIFARGSEGRIMADEGVTQASSSITNMNPVVKNKQEFTDKKTGKAARHKKVKKEKVKKEKVKKEKVKKEKVKKEKVKKEKVKAPKRAAQEDKKIAKAAKENKKIERENKKRKNIERIKSKKTERKNIKSSNKLNKKEDVIAPVIVNQEQANNAWKIEQGRMMGKKKLEEIKVEMGLGA